MSKFTSDEGWLCLDFVNTLKQNDAGALQNYADLVAWSRQYGIITSDEKANLLLQVAEHQPEFAGEVFHQVVRLRRALFGLLSPQAEGQSSDASDLEAFNQFLPEALIWLQLSPGEDRFNWQWIDAGNNLNQVWWQIVWSAVQLLRSDDLTRVRICASETCNWMFIDTSRNRSRRWCSMDSCGNRDKVRRYLQRHKNETPHPEA